MDLPPLDIAPGIRCIPVRSPTLPPATHTNVWVLGIHRLTVVDPASPWDDEQARLFGALSQLGAVERIVLTHHHHDHHQGAGPLARLTGAPVYAHPETRARLTLETEVLVDGGTFDTDAGPVVAHHTPGHAPGHLALQTASGHLVAGDLVAGVGTILIEPEDDGHLATYLDSLARMRDLRPTALLPAHGPVLDDPTAALTHYIEHRHARTTQVRESLARRSPARPLDLAADVYADLDPRFHALAARQIEAHLIWLAEQGLAASTEAGWISC